MAQKQEMKPTSNVEHRTSNAELQSALVALDVRRSAFGVRRLPSLILRALGFIVAAIFIYAGVLKVLDPVGFARDIDNYKLLPWPAAVALGFYLPWLEILCGFALIVRRFYQGGLFILTVLTIVFIVVSVIAKARGLDISCGCFGHVGKGWSFGWHLLLDFGILAALLLLWAAARERRTVTQPL
jgi:uncharacterized membrane protein YphA (DoxX/SURF4 family)